jgi:hypothetical protein
MSRLPWISKIGPRLRKALLVLSLLLLILLVFPFQTITVPTWSLRVVDESGSPVPGISVTEHWQHYLLESSGHQEVRQTEPNGRVSFPGRTIRASLLRRFLATISRLGKSGADGKREPYASVVVWGSAKHETAVAVYHPKQALQPEVVVHTTP